MKCNIIFIQLIAGLISLSLIGVYFPGSNSTENSAPKVTIITPLAKSSVKWNTLVKYAISVNDEEDGNSEFNEIPSQEVILKVTYLPDSLKLIKYLADRPNTTSEPAGLSLIRTSDCFNCHASKSKLMGPSFEMIAKRYPFSQKSIKILTDKVINGSKGVWGNNQMPAHPDLKATQLNQVIRWILTENSDPDVIYFAGTEGAFRTRERPLKNAGKGIYVLTASYRDHGLKESAQLKKTGYQTIVLKCDE